MRKLIAQTAGASALVGVVLTALTRSSAAPPAIVVGPEVLVSGGDSLASYSEYMADVDPDHPERLMACAQPYIGEINERKVTLHLSFDGGKTWRLGIDRRPLREGLAAGDPTCAYGLGDTALFSVLVEHADDKVG